MPFKALEQVGAGTTPQSGDPGQFRLGEPGLFREMVLDAGFVEVTVDEVDLSFKFASLADLLDWVTSQSQVVASALTDGGPELQDAFDSALADQIAPWTSEAGAIDLPGVGLVVTAEA
jgi:hypothetical protein